MSKIFQKLSDNIYSKLKKNMPPISETERVAIESGNTWIEADVFKGKIDPKSFNEIKNSELTSKESDFIKDKVIPLLSMIDKKSSKDCNVLTEEVWTFLKENKFFGMIIPEEYGGLEFSSYANSTIVSMIAASNIDVAVTVMVPNSLGPGELLMKYGTQSQKDLWLGKLANAQEIPCFALTTPKAGSDAGAISDIGIVEERLINDKKVIGLNINFNKRYITLAPKATLLGLAFKMQDPNNILGDRTDYGITCALFPMNTDGVDNSNRHVPMNLSFMNGPVFGENVFVPIEDIIGGQENAGRGWEMLVACLSAGRGVSLPALGSATTQAMYKGTSAYSLIRKQFGTSISNFEGVEEGLIEIAGFNYINEAMRKFTTTSIDMGNHPAIVTAITKYHSTEFARKSLQHSMDIHAGKAIMAGESNYHLDAYKGIPIAITVEGANILTRNLMIFGQGSIRCHPYLLEEMSLLGNENEIEAKEKFKPLLKEHIKYTTKNGAKSFINNLTFNFFESTFGDNDLKKEKKMINSLSKKLAFVSDISLLLLGGKLKRSEVLSSRLGDVLSYMYMALAVIKYYEENKTLEDKIHAKWELWYLFNKSSESFSDFFDNFPNKIISSGMKAVTFTFGVRIKKQSHEESKQLVSIMHSNIDFRNRLTSLVHVSEKHPLKSVEDAFEQKLKEIHVFNEMKKNNKTKDELDNEDIAIVEESERLSNIAINVDYEKV